MPGERIEELHEFHRFVTNQLRADGVNLSPEEALDEWRRLPLAAFSCSKA